jgi:hypothetical protein
MEGGRIHPAARNDKRSAVELLRYHRRTVCLFGRGKILKVAPGLTFLAKGNGGCRETAALSALDRIYKWRNEVCLC